MPTFGAIIPHNFKSFEILIYCVEIFCEKFSRPLEVKCKFQLSL